MNAFRIIARGFGQDPAFYAVEAELYVRVRDFGGVLFGLAAALSLGDPAKLGAAITSSVLENRGPQFFAVVFIRLFLIALIWHFFSRTHIVVAARTSMQSALALSIVLIVSILPVISMFALPVGPIDQTTSIAHWLTDYEPVFRFNTILGGVAFAAMGVASAFGLTKWYRSRRLILDPTQRWLLIWNAVSTIILSSMLLSTVYFGWRFGTIDLAIGVIAMYFINGRWRP